MELTKRQKWIIAGVILCVITIFVAGSAYINYKLSKAEEAVIAARAQAQTAQALADEATKQLKDISEEAAKRINEQQTFIDRTMAELERSRQNERRALDRIVSIQTDRQTSINSIATESDVQLAVSISQFSGIVYPEARPAAVSTTNGGFYVNRDGAELFKRALIDTESYRRENDELRGIIVSKDNTIAKLDEVVEAKDEIILQMDRRFDGFEAQFDAMKRSNDAHLEHVKALEEQVRLLKKTNFWNTWKGRVVNIAMLGGATYLGTQLR